MPLGENPCGSVADEGAEYGDNGGLLATRVLHETLECVDAAEADGTGAATEICGGGVVAVGNLPLLGDLQLPGRCLVLLVSEMTLAVTVAMAARPDSNAPMTVQMAIRSRLESGVLGCGMCL